MSPLALRSVRVALGASLFTGLVLAFVPLAGVPGPEAAVVLGLLLPPFAGAAGARVALAGLGAGVPPWRAAWHAAAVALGMTALAGGVLLVHAWLAGACDPVGGLGYVAFGPGFGTLLAAVTGVLVGALVRRPRLATWLAALVPVGSYLLALARFYGTPNVDSFGQFHGWFPGTIYDEGTAIRGAYLALRIATTALVLGTVALLAALGPRGRLAHLARRKGAVLVALGLFAVAGGLESHGEGLGMRGSRAHLFASLGGRRRGERCDVVFPRELPAAEARLLADDCSFRVVAAERALGVRHPARVTAFFFRSVEEKRALMGAAETYIAKPWRDEVYLQLEPFPHTVLAHELAHVVAGAAGRGPFRIAGSLGGLWPDPGAIEGVAVAVAWDSRDGLSPDEWARAMIDSGVAPTLADALHGFLFQPASRAYTIAGSFYRFLLEVKGPRVVRRAYETADLAAATGESLASLDRQWRARLRTVPLTDDARGLAAVRFARGAIFARACPHEVAALHAELAGDLAANDDARAVQTCREVLAIDPGDQSTRTLYVGALVRSGARGDAERELARLGTRWGAPAPLVATAREALADEAWRRGDRARAARLYRALLGAPRAADARRILEVKLLAVEAGGRTAEVLRELLAATSPPDGATAVHLARELGTVRADGLAPYLEARQMARVARWADALALLREARRRGLPTRLLRAEARRLQGVAAYAAGDLDASEAAWREAVFGPEPLTLGGDLADARSFLDRIAWKRRDR